jgi:hypothetical protein
MKMMQFLYIVIFFPSTVFSQSILVSDRDFGFAWGYLLSQDYVLEVAASKYPDLSQDILLAVFNFNRTFGEAKENVEIHAHQIFGQSYQDNKRHYLEMVRQQIDEATITRQVAVQYIQEINERSNATIPSPILETLLTYEYYYNPANEIIEGYYEQYRTNDHYKAKGLDFSLAYPRSWASQEGKRPNVIQLFKSEISLEGCVSTILVQNLIDAFSYYITQGDQAYLSTREWNRELADEVFSQGQIVQRVQEMSFTNPKEISTRRVQLDRCPGVIVEFRAQQSQMEHTIDTYNMIVMVIYDRYLLTINFNIIDNPDDESDDFEGLIERNKPLFDVITNSLVVYK